MKRRLFVIIVLTFLSTSDLFSSSPEFWIKRLDTESGTIQIRIRNTGFTWLWDHIEHKAVLAPVWDSTFVGHTIAFGAPAAEVIPHTMPWGLMEFSFTDGDWSPVFYIDFRDQNWSQGQPYENPDINLEIDFSTNTIQLAYRHTQTIITPISSGDTIRIWDAYGVEESALVSNFKIPITVTNIVNAENAGGTLKVESSNVNSGEAGPVDFGTSSATVATNNERFSNYQGSGTTYKHNKWNNQQDKFELDQMIEPTYNSLDQQARFLPVSLCTLRVEFGGTVLTESDGATIKFKDPWYKHSDGAQPNTFITYNSPHSPSGAYGVSGPGVFLGLDPQNTPVYYSVEAVSPFNYNRLKLVFDHWSSPNSGARFGSSTQQSTYVIFDNSGAIVTANYKVEKPYDPPNVSAGGAVGSPVQITWDEHPSTGVTQYQIWRSIHPDPAQLLATQEPGNHLSYG